MRASEWQEILEAFGRLHLQGGALPIKISLSLSLWFSTLIFSNYKGCFPWHKEESWGQTAPSEGKQEVVKEPRVLDTPVPSPPTLLMTQKMTFSASHPSVSDKLVLLQ